MRETNHLELASLSLVVAGALNWGLIGLGTFAGGDWNIIGLFFGELLNGRVESIIYFLIGLAGLHQLYFGYELSQ